MNIKQIYVSVMTNDAIPVLARYGPYVGGVSIETVRRILSAKIQVAVRDINNQNAIVITYDIFMKNKDIVKYITDLGYDILETGKVIKKGTQKIVEAVKVEVAPIIEEKKEVEIVEKITEEGETVEEVLNTETTTEDELVSEEQTTDETKEEVITDGTQPVIPRPQRNKNRGKYGNKQ